MTPHGYWNSKDDDKYFMVEISVEDWKRLKPQMAEELTEIQKQFFRALREG